MRWLMKSLIAVITLSAMSAGSAYAEYPDRPIHLLVPYPPGGLVDTMARTMQEPLSKALGQPVIVDNKPGAAGAIATRSVAQAAPDGYTLIFGNNGPSALLPLVQKDIGYDPIADFEPISMIATAPMVMVIHQSVPAKDLKEFIGYALQNPGTIAYSSAGSGSLGHLASELFAHVAGVKLIHVPYKGSAPAVMAVLGGEVKMYLSSPSDTLTAGIKAGKVRLIGESSSSPSSLAPGAAPIADVLPGFDVLIWYGVLAPRKTPKPIIDRLNKAFSEVLAQKNMRDRFHSYGADATTSSPEELTRRIAEEVPKWRDLIETARIAAQ
ncbi:MAG: tripartite tricarboxylate transporter substrate binding protein [Proteobacteria bacterium]|nr:tripartite tricarboxylate transporter substrate binding protein [Pseudomonadota bacterium]